MRAAERSNREPASFRAPAVGHNIGRQPSPRQRLGCFVSRAPPLET
jgi:hypothetical protein